MAALGEWGVRRRPEEAAGYELDEDDDDDDDDDDGGGDADGFTLDEVLRLGGTKVRGCGRERERERVGPACKPRVTASLPPAARLPHAVLRGRG